MIGLAPKERLHRPLPPASGQVEGDDFDVHGLVGIRLVDASPEERAAVGSQLGPVARRLDREPDIVVRFVDRLRNDPLRLIGVGETGYSGDSFLILRSRHKTPARVELALDTVGGRCEIVCERGLPSVPLLLPIINLTALAKGGLALHASAFRFRERGVLVTGWSKSGKTETLLAFLEQGARYIGDEWIYLDPDGESMYGIPEPVRVWDWHLDQLPHYRRALRPSVRWRLRALRLGSGVLRTLATPLPRADLIRLQALIERQRYAFLPPETSFAGGGSLDRSAVDRVFFLVNAESAATRVERVNPQWIAERMAFSMEEERERLMAAYRQFRFAFPERVNPFLEGARALEADRLSGFLESVPCYAVSHPYPPSLAGLFDAMAPLVSE